MSPQRHVLRGVATFVGALLILPAMDAIAKYESAQLSALEIVWARYVIFALALLPPALVRHGRAVLRPARPGLQLLRGALMALSAWMFFCAVARMPLANAMAVFFAYPLVVLLLSDLVLGERTAPLTWLLVLSGFGGVLLVTHPGIGSVPAGSGYVLVAAVGYASAMLLTRRLASEDASLVTAALSAACGALGYTLAVPLVWVTPHAFDWILLSLMGVIAAVGHYLLIRAHRDATAAQLAPFGYTEIVSAVVLGMWIFGDVPGRTVWLGIGIIVASGSLAMRVQAGSTARRSAAATGEPAAAAGSGQQQPQRQHPDGCSSQPQQRGHGAAVGEVAETAAARGEPQ